MQDEDPYDPGDEEVAQLNRSTDALGRLTADSNERYAKRRKKHGVERAGAGIWNDNPEGKPIWKATIAGIAVAHQEMADDQGNSIDAVAEAAGLSNKAKAMDLSTRSEDAIVLKEEGREYSPGDSGKNVKRFIAETRRNNDAAVQTEFERAKAGDLLVERLDSFQVYVGRYGPLKKPTILHGVKSTEHLTLRQSIAKARSTGDHSDRKIACHKLLLAAEAVGVGRYLFHGKRKPRSTN